jgi:hypothetical protein
MRRDPALLSVVTVAVAGCAASQGAPTSAARTPGQPSTESTATTRVVGPERPKSQSPAIVVVDAGALPRRRLRYTFSTKPDALALDMRMHMELGVGSEKIPPVAFPTIRTFVDVTPKAVAPNGDLDYEVRIAREQVLDDGGLSSVVRRNLEAELDALDGTTLRSTITPRGLVQAASIDVPASAAPQFRQLLDTLRESLQNLSSPLPEEEVGAGAVWRVEKSFETGFHAKQTETFTLRSLGATSAELGLALSQSAAPQTVDTPTPEPDTNVTLQRLQGSGTGSLKLALDRVAPLGQVASDTEMQFLVETSGQKTTTTTKLHVDVVTREKP